MIRKIAYITLFIGVTLTVANLSLTNTLATEGIKLSDIGREKETKVQTVEKLEQQIMTLTSLTRISTRAAELGLTENYQ